MKKIILLFLSIFLINQTASAFYSDVSTNHQYYNSIKNLYDLNLLPEYEYNLFKPDERATINDLYKLIFTYGNNKSATEVRLPSFSNPDKTIGKYYALSTIFKTLGIGSTYFFNKDEFPFIDIKTDSDTAIVAMKAAGLGIFEEENPDYFKKTKRITKAQIADYLYKIYEQNGAAITVTIEPVNNAYTNIEKEFLENEKFSILLDIWSSLQTEFYYKNGLNDDELIYGAINGLIDKIEDIYTDFQEPSEAKKFLESLSNEYEGIGMIIELIDKNITIVSPLKDSPAEKAGLKPNDIIIEVNDENVIGQSLDAVVGKIKGPAGTTVKIKILRGNEGLKFTVERESILYPNVKYELLKNGDKDIAYIEIISFGNTSYNDFLQAAESLIEENPDGFIIDLRNNPGGYMNSAINIISLFTDEIVTAVTLEYADATKEEYKTIGNGLLKDYKTVVLINEGSASASEILAGALQDHGIAKIIGRQSFGKGCVQELTEYIDGSIFKYTISKWLTPNGTDIDQTGITPDEIVENSENNDKQLEEALKEF